MHYVFFYHHDLNEVHYDTKFNYFHSLFLTDNNYDSAAKTTSKIDENKKNVNESEDKG